VIYRSAHSMTCASRRTCSTGETKLAEQSERQADYAWSVLMRLISFARGRGMTKYRLPEQVDRLYTPDRSDKIWTDDNIATFMKVAPAPLQHAMILALETAQREGDLIVMPWSAYGSDERGKCIRLRPGKTKTRKHPQGRLVRVPVTQTLANMLERMPRISTQILTSEKRRPWNPKGNGFRSSWQKACKRAGIRGLTFHDLRGTAITQLSEVYTPREIAQWTGQSVRDIQNIIERYLARTSAEAPDVTKIGRGVSRT
jgi:integrase